MKQANFLSSSRLFLYAGLLSAAVIGCGKEEIKVYTAPKDIATAPVSHAHQDSTPASAPFSSPAHSAPSVTWKTPSTWEEVEPTTMRVGNFAITEGDQKAEMAILPFPGTVGGDLDNVNRWRGEIGLGPVKEGEYESETVRIGSDSGKLFDLQGEKLSTLAAMLEKDGTSWFFKMRGDKELVAKNKPVLVEFLKSIEFGVSTKEAASSPDSDPSEVVSAPKDSRWQIPAHWKLAPDRPMVIRNWDVGDEGKTANIAINSFPGDVGGVVANVNRWRGQLTLPPLSDAEVRDALKELETSDPQIQAQYVDFTGKDRNGVATRMISAIVPRDGETWFYKIQGAPDVVEREKTAFLKLVQTARYD